MKLHTILLLTGTLYLSAGSVFAATSSNCPGESGYYFTNDRETNPRRGGFVSDSAYVSEAAFIAPTTSICGSATIESNVRVMGKAIVKGEAYISGHVRITGNAIIGGTAEISGEYKKTTVIQGYARIFEGFITSGRHGSNQKPKALLNKEKEEKDLAQKKQAFDGIRNDLVNLLNKDLNKNYHYIHDFGRLSTEIRVSNSGNVKVGSDCTFSLDYTSRSYRYDSESYDDRLKNKVDAVNLKGLKISFETYNHGSNTVEFYSLNFGKEIVEVRTGGEKKNQRKVYVHTIGDESKYETHKKLNALIKSFKAVGDHCGFRVSQPLM